MVERSADKLEWSGRMKVVVADCCMSVRMALLVVRQTKVKLLSG